MKRIGFVVALAIVLLGSSCKRQYGCTCTRTVNSVPGDEYTYDATGDSPTDACNAVDDDYVMGGDSVIVNCEPM